MKTADESHSMFPVYCCLSWLLDIYCCCPWLECLRFQRNIFTLSIKYFCHLIEVIAGVHRAVHVLQDHVGGACKVHLERIHHHHLSIQVALNMGFDLALEQKLGRLRNAADIFILSCFSIQPELDLVDLTNASEAWWLTYMPLCKAPLRRLYWPMHPSVMHSKVSLLTYAPLRHA